MYIQHSNMLANRVQYFMRSILQNSKLNREKFVNNKKKYNMTAIKHCNHNMIIKRVFGSSFGYMRPNKEPDGPDWKSFILVACGIYLIDKMNNYHKSR